MQCWQGDVVNSYEPPHSLDAFRGLVYTLSFISLAVNGLQKGWNKPRVGWISACVVELGLFLVLPLCTLWGWFLGAVGLLPAAPAASPPPQLASQYIAVLPSFSSLAPLSLFLLPIAPPLPSLLSCPLAPCAVLSQLALCFRFLESQPALYGPEWSTAQNFLLLICSVRSLFLLLLLFV